MILAVDIGNTGVSLGLYNGDRIEHMGHCDSEDPAGARTALESLSSQSKISGVVIASVVPERSEQWHQLVREICRLEPLFINCDLELGIDIDYPTPAEIGADRLANACGAVALFGAPVVVADFGTALTFDVISAKRAYIGGVIAPGLPLMFDYLAEKTALLPRLEPRGVANAVGKSTEEAMQIGAKSGYCGMIAGILNGLRQELKEFEFCATGGYANWVLEECSTNVVIVPELTLLGQGRIYDLN